MWTSEAKRWNVRSREVADPPIGRGILSQHRPAKGTERMSITTARLPKGLVLVLVVSLAACSSASSGPTPGHGSPVAAAPSVVAASILPATVAPTPTPTPVPVTPAPTTRAPTICASSCVVKMLEQAYVPVTLNIKVGTEVIWSNTGCHGGCTVTFPGTPVDSGPMAIGATFKHTFGAAGVFAFHCQLDPDEMKGTIVVTN
jgi:plastocyanin